MKIGVNARMLLSSGLEGIGRYSYETLLRMVKEHPEVEFVFMFDRSYNPKFKFQDNVTPVVVRPQARHPFLWHLWFEYGVHYTLKKYEVDCFYSPEAYLSKRSKVPTLIVSHDIAYSHFPSFTKANHLNYYKKNFPLFHQRADHIVAVSQFTKTDIIKQYNIEEGKISVAYNAGREKLNPISEEQKITARNKFAQSKPYFLYLGSINPRKNTKGLIEAFNLFKAEHTGEHQLVLAGAKAWKDSDLEDLYQESPNRDSIHFPGRIGSDIELLIGGCEAFVYPSFFEGFGIPILEAFQAQVPVICSNVSSMPEVAGPAAILIDPHDPRSIAKAMGQIISEQTLATALIEKGKEQLKRFNWNDSAAHIFSQLEKLC